MSKKHNHRILSGDDDTDDELASSVIQIPPQLAAHLTSALFLRAEIAHTRDSLKKIFTKAGIKKVKGKRDGTRAGVKIYKQENLHVELDRSNTQNSKKFSNVRDVDVKIEGGPAIVSLGMRDQNGNPSDFSFVMEFGADRKIKNMSPSVNIRFDGNVAYVKMEDGKRYSLPINAAKFQQYRKDLGLDKAVTADQDKVVVPEPRAREKVSHAQTEGEVEEIVPGPSLAVPTFSLQDRMKHPIRNALREPHSSSVGIKLPQSHGKFGERISQTTSSQDTSPVSNAKIPKRQNYEVAEEPTIALSTSNASSATLSRAPKLPATVTKLIPRSPTNASDQDTQVVRDLDGTSRVARSRMGGKEPNKLSSDQVAQSASEPTLSSKPSLKPQVPAHREKNLGKKTSATEATRVKFITSLYTPVTVSRADNIMLKARDSVEFDGSKSRQTGTPMPPVGEALLVRKDIRDVRKSQSHLVNQDNQGFRVAPQVAVSAPLAPKAREASALIPVGPYSDGGFLVNPAVHKPVDLTEARDKTLAKRRGDIHREQAERSVNAALAIENKKREDAAKSRAAALATAGVSSKLLDHTMRVEAENTRVNPVSVFSEMPASVSKAASSFRRGRKPYLLWQAPRSADLPKPQSEASSLHVASNETTAENKTMNPAYSASGKSSRARVAKLKTETSFPLPALRSFHRGKVGGEDVSMTISRIAQPPAPMVAEPSAVSSTLDTSSKSIRNVFDVEEVVPVDLLQAALAVGKKSRGINMNKDNRNTFSPTLARPTKGQSGNFFQ